MPRAKRPCPVPGCPELTDGGRCPTHKTTLQRTQDAQRGTPTERGYGPAHRRLRARIARTLEGRPCARECGHIFRHGEPFDLDHTDDRSGYLGPSCPSCNRSAAGRAPRGGG